MRSLPFLLSLSLVAALIGFLRPIILPLADAPMRADERAIFWPVAIWGSVLVFALARHGKRGLWLLIGAPFVLFWPFSLCWIVLVCTFGPECM